MRRCHAEGLVKREPVSSLVEVVPDALDDYDGCIARLSEIHVHPNATVQLTPEAQIALTEARHHIEDLARLPVFDERQRVWLSKGGTHLARLTMLFHAIMTDPASPGFAQVPPTTVERVRDAYLNYFLPCATVFYRTVLGRTERSAMAIWVAGFILAHAKQKVTARDIARAYRELRPATGEDYGEVRQVMETLELAGWVQPVTGTAYRPATKWLVNPKVHA